MAFDRQPVLEGPHLRMRPLAVEDRDNLYTAASDPRTWAGHPVKNRHEKEVFFPYFDLLLGTGETLVAVDKATDQIIGCSRYYTPPHRPGTIAIGYTFLNPSYWGGPTNFEMKTLMLNHAFAMFDEVWLDIGPDNIRSQKAASKIKAKLREQGRYDLGSGREDDYMCFVITRADWDACND